MQFRSVTAFTLDQIDAASIMNGTNAHNTSETASATQSDRHIQGLVCRR